MSISPAAGRLQMVGQASERAASRTAMKVFWTCTAFVWGGVGVCAVLFSWTSSRAPRLGSTRLASG